MTYENLWRELEGILSTDHNHPMSLVRRVLSQALIMI